MVEEMSRGGIDPLISCSRRRFMISLAANHNSLLIRCHSDAAAFPPDLKLGLCAFRFCHLHCSSRFHWACPVAFESARPSRPCNPPDAGNCPTGRSTQVFRPMQVGVFRLLRRCRGRTKWANGTSGSERRDTIADQLWAIEKYSTDLTSILNAGVFA